MEKYRLRYAPSPTGNLHIGNARTALINYLFAKHHSGDFIVRLEDTDLARNVEGAIESQFSNLDWLGLKIDESYLKPKAQYGPYIQSQKFKRYQELAHQLVKEHKAYYCFCSEEELNKDYEIQKKQGIISTRYRGRCRNLSEAEIQAALKAKKPYSIRFRVPPDRRYKFQDLVRGNIEFNSGNLGDFVILKTNGIPTYNFAVAIDDHDMQISHVVRGEEHISNTPLQLMIYEAFGWQPPQFAHLTLITDQHGKKLSKRSGNQLFFIDQYRKSGYLPQAIFNYIALLGWSPAHNREILSAAEIIKDFDPNRFSKAPSTFDVKKLQWINNQHLKRISSEEYLKFVRPFVNSKYFERQTNEKWWTDVLLLFKNELEYAAQINNYLIPFFTEQKLQSSTWKMMIKNFPHYRQLAANFRQEIEANDEWNEESIKKAIDFVGKKLNIKGKALFMPLRLMATQQEHGPALAKFIDLLGKNKVLTNLKQSMVK